MIYTLLGLELRVGTRLALSLDQGGTALGSLTQIKDGIVYLGPSIDDNHVRASVLESKVIGVRVLPRRDV